MILETLAESRVSVLYLARRAREEKNKSLAEELSSQAKTLQSEITRLRRAAHVVWPAEANVLTGKFVGAQSRLTKIVEGIAKDQRRLQSSARVLSAVRGLFDLTARLGL
jgi:hypothetical protein